VGWSEVIVGDQGALDGRADLAVHSAKDVPFFVPEPFLLSAFPEREDPHDALVAPSAKTFARLPTGARVGTSSLRRAVQLRAARPDLERHLSRAFLLAGDIDKPQEALDSLQQLDPAAYEAILMIVTGGFVGRLPPESVAACNATLP